MPRTSAISNRVRRRPVSSFNRGGQGGGGTATLATDGTDLVPIADVAIPAHHSIVVARYYKIASGNSVALASGAILRIL